uniref:Uncharacterized protein n=1 Tax=Cacopsylla melanoneura TaxID=428564 RepID=A0A8D9C0V3_9HEMI
MANSKFTFTDGVLKTSSAIPVEGIDLHVISPAAYSPVSFRGIPYYLNTLWTDLKAIAPPDLRLTMTDPLFRILLKFTLYALEMKVQFAQRRCGIPLNPAAPQLNLHDEDTRNIILADFHYVPVTLAHLFDILGFCEVSGTTVVPRLTIPSISPAGINLICIKHCITCWY